MNITTITLSLLTKIKVVIASFSTLKAFLLIPILAVPFVIKTEYTILLLLCLMVVDFATGVLASNEKRKRYLKTDEALKGKFTISSGNLKKSGVKFLLYFTTIITAFFMEKIFFIKSFSFDFSEAELRITIIVIGFWVCVEVYSIVFENIRELGFDLYGYVKNAIKKINGLKSEISS